MLEGTRQGADVARVLWEKLIVEKYTIVVSEDMLSTIFYIEKDKRKTLEFFKIITKRWTVVPFGKKVLEDACNLALEKDLDFEDVLQCLCAKAHGCDVLITNDKKFYDCGLEISSSEVFIKVRDADIVDE